MAKFVSILRGINVSGQKAIKMTELKALYQDLGFANVQTYIQSGNVVYDSERSDLDGMIDDIETAIRLSFAFEVPVQIRSQKNLQTIIDRLPFSGELQHNRLLVTFLAEEPVTNASKNIEALKAVGDEIAFEKQHIYLYLPAGIGRSKINNNSLERYLKVNATTRNWRTVNKLLDMCE